MIVDKPKFENEYISFELKNGILFCCYKAPVISLEVAQEVVKSRKIYTENKSYPNLVISMNIGKVEKQARDFLSTGVASEGVSAGALLSDSIFQTTIANFFLTVSKPKLPTRLFTKETEAIEWLNQYK
jgi:hypothetical protein